MPFAHSEFAKLIIHYKGFSGYMGISKTGDLDLMSVGICQLVGTTTTYVYRLCEPLVIKCLSDYVGQNYMTLYFGPHLVDFGRSASACGDLLDFNIGILLCSLEGSTIRTFLEKLTRGMLMKPNLPSSVDGNFTLQSVIGSAHREAMKQFVVPKNIKLLEFAKESKGTQYYLPNTKTEKGDGCGPMQTVMITTGMKFSGDGNVGSDEVDANFKATENMITMLESVIVQKKLDVIRLHVILPGGADRDGKISNPSFPPGVFVNQKKITQKDNQIYQYTEICININCTNLSLFFPPDLAKLWIARTKIAQK